MSWKGESRRHAFASKGIKSEIKSRIKEYKKTPCDINAGLCEDFAWSLAKKIPNARVSESNWDVIFVNKKGKKEWIPTHFWITLNNRHYDAECPEGVDDYHDLPIFVRAGIQKDIDFIIDWGEPQ